MVWEPPEIPDGEDDVTARILDGMAVSMPGWDPVEGAPEVALAEELGREAALLNQRTIEVLELAIAGIGETAFGFPAYLGVAADIAVQLTVITAGDLVPSGFTVVGINDNGDEVAFTLLEDVVTLTLTDTVTMTALEPGDAGNNVPAGPLTIVTSTTGVLDAEALTPSSDGADPEVLTDYLTRLTDYLSSLRPGGVTGSDLALLARTVPGVHRALGVDLHDPADPGTPAERTATVFLVDVDGAPVAAPIADQVEALLESAREVNFVIHVGTPAYTVVDVVYDAVAETGADPGTVETAIENAVLGWLATWGTTTEDDQAWTDSNVVRYLEAARVAGSAAGVAFVSSLTINGVEGDLVLAGVAPLPASPTDLVAPSTCTGTVT